MIYHPLTQQYNCAINISYAQPNASNHEQVPQGKQEFEFLDVMEDQIANDGVQKLMCSSGSKGEDRTVTEDSEQPINITKVN